jgi:hypothetical protein
MHKLPATALLASVLLSSAACGQNVGDGQPMVAQPSAQTTPAPAPAATPKYDSLAVPGPDGKIVRLEGIIDLLALHKNPLVDAATLERVRPVVKEWMKDVDQIAIDNLDFIHQIEPLDGSPGIIDRFDITATDRLTTLGQIMTHLMSNGPLAPYLETKGALNREQSQLNQTISADYLQRVMNEIMADAGMPNNLAEPAKDEQEKTERVNTVSRFLYGLSCRDAVQSYHRILVQTAPNIDRVLTAISVPVPPAAAKAKAAKTSEEKRAAVREVMKGLSFDQQRALLEKGRELAGDFDPLAAETAAAPARTAPTASR